jgi:mevalonate kinase
MLEWTLIVLLAGALVACLYGIKVLAAKISTYEEYIAQMKDRFNIAYEVMKQADIRGSFEADDEVGSSFQIMKQAVDNLNSFVKDEETFNV